MKTSSKFNKVINDAGKLALTEGHTVQSSSPRVSPCGLLSFKGDIMKTKVIKGRIAVNPWKDQRKSGWKIFCDAKCAEGWGAPLHIQQAVTDYEGAKCDQCKTILSEN